MSGSRWKYEAVHLRCGNIAFWLKRLDRSLRDQRVLRSSGRVGLGAWSRGVWGFRIYCRECGNEDAVLSAFQFRRTTTEPPAMRRKGAGGTASGREAGSSKATCSGSSGAAVSPRRSSKRSRTGGSDSATPAARPS